MPTFSLFNMSNIHFNGDSFINMIMKQRVLVMNGDQSYFGKFQWDDDMAVQSLIQGHDRRIYGFDPDTFPTSQTTFCLSWQVKAHISFYPSMIYPYLNPTHNLHDDHPRLHGMCAQGTPMMSRKKGSLFVKRNPRIITNPEITNRSMI